MGDAEQTSTQKDPKATADKEADDPNSLKHLQLELNEIALSRYDINTYLGRGSYGVVVAAEDKTTQEKVAIKRIYPDVLRNPFLGTRVVREIKLLAHFNHPNIIGIRNLFTTLVKGKESVWMVMDVMDMDLQGLIRSGQPISEQHVQFFTAQILSALECIHEAGVIHRDLTPSNCLLDINCDLRICDFGLAREEDNFMTDYVVMRWYRAPELLMQLPQYNTAVDVWAAGCIMGQMLHKGKPLFKGNSSLQQLESIIDLLGTPSDATLTQLGASSIAKAACRKRGYIPPAELTQLLALPDGGPVSEKCLDLLQRLLTFNPKERLTARQAQRHHYIKSVGYRVDCRPSPFCFPVTHEFEIDEVMEQLKLIQREKSWGGAEPPLDRIMSTVSNLSSRSLSLYRPESGVEPRTGLMGQSSGRTAFPRGASGRPANTPAHGEGGECLIGHMDLHAESVLSTGDSELGEGERQPVDANLFSGIPTLP